MMCISFVYSLNQGFSSFIGLGTPHGTEKKFNNNWNCNFLIIATQI